MLAQKGENLTRGFEDEAHDRAKHSGVMVGILELLSYNLSAVFEPLFYSQGNHAQNNTDSHKKKLEVSSRTS